MALIEAIEAIVRAESIPEIVRATLEVIRRRFGWAYGSYWAVDPDKGVLTFSLESGEVDAEFHRVTRSARFREGEGLNGRAWQHRDLVYVADLGELADCCRAPVARRAGIRSGVAPADRPRTAASSARIDFFASEASRCTRRRLDALRAIGRVASDKIAQARPPGRADPDHRG